MHLKQRVEHATCWLERILEYTDEELDTLSEAGRAAVGAIIEVLDQLQQIPDPALVAVDASSLTVWQQNVERLGTELQSLDALLPAEPDYFAGQGHLGAFFDDLSEADRGLAADLPSELSLSYYHNTLLDCRARLQQALQRPLPADFSGDQAPTLPVEE